ncbi:MAG: hypothetical protein WBM40_08970 [Thiohalocapsa sp.]
MTGADRLSSRRWLTNEDLILEFALNAFRLVDGVEASLFQRQTGLGLAQIEPVLARARRDGLLNPRQDRLCPSVHGLRFLNDLVARFEKD